MLVNQMMDVVFRSFDNSIYSKMTPSLYNNFVQNYNFSSFHNLSFESCAVVGSSSTLLKKPEGQYIDSHTFVIRTNGFPYSKQYEPFLGSKISLVLTAGTKHTRGSNKNFVYCLVPWVGSCWWDSLRDHLPRISPGFVKRVKKMLKLRMWPSTGLMAVSFARLFCKSVNTFGFGIDQTFSNCSHYYNVDTVNFTRCVYPKIGFFRLARSNYNKYKTSSWHEFIKESKHIHRTMPGWDIKRLL